MKILFLDCDGVINCDNTFKQNARGEQAYIVTDPYMCFLVGKIQLDTGCQVVLSSAWRHHDESVAYLNRRVVPIFDTTPDMPRSEDSGIEYCERGREIKAWLDTHPEVTRYAILDDSADMLPEQLPNFFKTSWVVGLTEEIAQAVINHLNQE